MGDSKPLAEILADIIKKSPTLSRLLLRGERIRDPFNLRGAQKKEEFTGKKFPTYFALTGNYTKEKPKACPINRKFRVQYETDAENDYFNRDRDPGEFRLKRNGSVIEDYSLNLWNGLATLTMSLPQGLAVGDLRGFETGVSDISRVTPYQDEFWIRVVERASQTNSPSGDRKKPPSEKEGKDRQVEGGLDMPQVVEIRQEDWEKDEYKEFNLDRNSSLKAKNAGDEKGCDFYINMDNAYLKNEMKEDRKTDPKILEERYKIGMVLLGMSILHHDENNGGGDKNGSVLNKNGLSVYEQISEFTEAVSPVLLPMIASLGSLEDDT